MASSPDAFVAWNKLAIELDDELEEAQGNGDADGLNVIVQQREPGERLALFDRNSLDTDEWRPVYLDLEEEVDSGGAQSTRLWRLSSILNVPIDEPDDGRAPPRA